MKTPKKSKNSEKKAAKKESLEERVHRHLNDINSKITDDDIRNVKTELEIRGKTSPKLKQENKGDKENTQSKPWDILSEGYD